MSPFHLVDYIWLRFLRFRNRDCERVCFRAVVSLQGTYPLFVFIESRGLRPVAFLDVILIVAHPTTFHRAFWVVIYLDVFWAFNAARMQGPVKNLMETWLA